MAWRDRAGNLRQRVNGAYPDPVRRGRGFAWILSLTLLQICGTGGVSGKEIESLQQSTTWNPAAGPYVIQEDLLIPEGVQLRIEAGTEILFQKGVSLIIQGDLIAVGTAQEPIRFSSAAPAPSLGDWGNLRFITADTTLSYDDAGNYFKGSRLEYCIIEYGGMPGKGTAKEFLGGAIHCKKSSPYFRNLTIRYNRSLTGGGIYCHEFASPYIEGCLFLENEAELTGGGLACFFYSNALIKRNIFQANKAGEHGGGIYFSFSSPQIIDNIIENNYARYQGGGLYGSNTVTQSISRVRNNVLLSNQAGYGASNIYVTAKLETVFQGNCLFSDGIDLFIEALEADLDFRGNYFGPLAAGDLEAKVRDRYDDPAQRTVLCDPLLEAPSPLVPNMPANIRSFDLFGDPEFSADWPFPLCPDAPIYLEIKATDRNPYHADWIAVRLRSSESDPRGVVSLAWETGPATGIFRLSGRVRGYSQAKEGAVRAQPGEILFFSLEGIEGFEISRRVDVSKSYIVAFQFENELDSLHVVNHNPQVSWEFRNIFGAPQKTYQLQIAQGSVFTAPGIWDSGIVPHDRTNAVITGVSLQDGERYSLRLRMNSGSEWSDWAEMPLRMNSLPTNPALTSPLDEAIVNQIRPTLSMLASKDAEGDPIHYEMQLYQDAAFTHVLAIEKELRASGQSVHWVAPIDLQDDAEYYWRARARDDYEIGAWTKAGHFYVNLVEEPPLAFSLTDPDEGALVYQLQPVFSWEKTIDPDPLSSVRYRLLVSSDSKFSPNLTIKQETDLTFAKLDQALKNDGSYYWKVEAIDNTQRITPSTQVRHFTASTTPTTPEIASPLPDQEFRPYDAVSWSQSQDPDPQDRIQYRIQITDKDFAKPLLEEVVTTNSLTLQQLQNYAVLADDREYRVRVRAEDQHGIASHWSKDSGSFFFNKANTPPGPVTQPIQPDGIVVASAEPILSWGAAQDADRSDPPSKLSYLIQFSKDESFQKVERQAQVMAGVTMIPVPGLADNTQWYFRICARDDEGAVSPWSPAKSFILNQRNDHPAPFALQGPADGLVTYQMEALELRWDASTDIDPGDKLRYRVFCEEYPGGLAVLQAKAVDSTRCVIPQTLKNETEYQWWVEAEDAAGARTASTEKRRFTINTTPSVPLVEPLTDGVYTGKEFIRWKPSTDPDPSDILTYDFIIREADNPAKTLLELNKIPASRAASGIGLADLKGVKQLRENQEYDVLMRAVDPHKVTSGWSDPIRFALDLDNEAPSQPSLLDPRQDVVQTTNIAVRWSKSEDPDPSDRRSALSYRLQAVRGDNFSKGEFIEKVIGADAAETTNLQLADNQMWSLRIRAEDSRGAASAWSQPVSFLVNLQEDPPTIPELLTPTIGFVIPAGAPVEFSWTSSTDPDFNASIRYELRWWPEDDPEAVITQTGLKSPRFTTEKLAGGRIYQWQVTAMDNTGLTAESAVGKFTCDAALSPDLNRANQDLR